MRAPARCVRGATSIERSGFPRHLGVGFLSEVCAKLRCMNDAHHVVIVGAAFGGLAAVQELAGAAVRITIIDQRNHHLFQPLLYQVATASLAPSEIAWPVRHLLRNRKEVTTLMAVVSGIDCQSNQLDLEDGSTLGYDTL